MEIEYIVNTVYNSITWIVPVGEEKKCLLVDCGDIEKVVSQGWYIQGVLLTHVHYDHIYGLNKLVSLQSNVVIYTNIEGQQSLYNPQWNLSRYHTGGDFIFRYPEKVSIFKCEGSCFLEDNIIVDVLFTPGHDHSCLSYCINQFLFTGDSYIPGLKVVTTFPHGDKMLATTSLNRLKKMERLGFKIMPGHKI